MVTNCCLNCNERKFLCHSNCKKYAELKETKAKQKAYLNEGKEADAYAISRSVRCKMVVRRIAKLIKFHNF